MTVMCKIKEKAWMTLTGSCSWTTRKESNGRESSSVHFLPAVRLSTAATEDGNWAGRVCYRRAMFVLSRWH
jgi:hypothetical protein